MIEIVLALVVVALFFVFMSVRMIFLKDGEFKGTCASQSPFLRQEGATCGYCGKKVDECELEDGEVNKVMAKFN
ncbi:MAG: hypothetical protein GY827_05830 [Cytophagales bacterium]|nr:hypothetical protein [Cytophagales bacterium]